MGLLYDVFYPNQTMDSDVGEGYLDRLARDPSNAGARATCTNGERQTLVLIEQDGELTWIDAPKAQARG